MQGLLRIKLLMATLAATALLLTITQAAPPQFRRGLAARQIVAAAAAPTTLFGQEQTPYPAAGYRPRIPFELPTNENRRQHKALPEPTTTPATTQETVEQVTAQAHIDVTLSVEEQDALDLNVQQQDADANANAHHMPANTYGAPPTRPTDIGDNTIENIAAPVNRFQPPNKEAVEDFGVGASVDDVDIEAGAEATTTTTSSSTTSKGTDLINESSTEAAVIDEEQEQEEAEVEQQHPEQVYGPPTLYTADGRQVPALTYGAPDISENELLVQQQELQRGRLIFIPNDGATQLRQIYFTAALPANFVGEEEQQMLERPKPAKLVGAAKKRSSKRYI